MENTVTLERAKEDAQAFRYLFEDEYRLLCILLLAQLDGWTLADDAQQEACRLIGKTLPEVGGAEVSVGWSYSH